MMIDWNILYTMIKNSGSYQMNHDMKGLICKESFKPVRHEESIAFAGATKDRNLPFYQKEGVIPPFYLSKLIFPMIKKILCHKDLRVNLMRVVLAQEEIIWYDTVKIGERLDISTTISNIYETDSGEMIEIRLQIFISTRLVIEGTIGFIIRSKKKVAKKKDREEAPGNELFQLEIQTDKDQQLKFAEVSGDHNFIHTNRFIAKIAGLPGMIMHGACVLAMICSAMVEYQLKNDPGKLKSISGRFSKPVIPGEQLILKGYTRKEPNSICFNVINPAGGVVFKNGIFRYK